MFRNKKALWAGLVIVILLTVGGIYYFKMRTNSQQALDTAPDLQTAVAQRGDLSIFASAVGEVIPSNSLSLGFETSGTITEILVTTGDTVQTGEVLARMRTDESEESIAAGLAEAELNVLIAQQDLDQLYADHPMQAALALKSIEDAQTDLDDLQNPEGRIAAAEVELLQAQQNFSDAQNSRIALDYARTDDLTIEKAYVDYLLAEEQYNTALKAFNLVAQRDIKNPDRVQALQVLISAEDKRDLLLATYNWLSLPASETDIAEVDAELAVAEAALTAAQAAYDKIAAGPTPGEIAVAQAVLSAAQSDYDRIKDGPDSLDIAIAEGRLASAEADLALAQETKAIVEIVAPIDGTILSISAGIGESFGTGTVMTIADLANPILEIFLDETDLDRVAVGFETEVIFDAYPDDLFHGIVIEVSPQLQSVGGLNAVVAMIRLTDYAKPQILSVGLAASVDVIGGRVVNGVLVPVEALRELGPDEYAVFVVENGEPKLRTVEVGLIDFTSAEIISGLDAGEIVTTGIVDTE